MSAGRMDTTKGGMTLTASECKRDFKKVLDFQSITNQHRGKKSQVQHEARQVIIQKKREIKEAALVAAATLAAAPVAPAPAAATLTAVPAPPAAATALLAPAAVGSNAVASASIANAVSAAVKAIAMHSSTLFLQQEMRKKQIAILKTEDNGSEIRNNASKEYSSDSDDNIIKNILSTSAKRTPSENDDDSEDDYESNTVGGQKQRLVAVNLEKAAHVPSRIDLTNAAKSMQQVEDASVSALVQLFDAQLGLKMTAPAPLPNDAPTATAAAASSAKPTF